MKWGVVRFPGSLDDADALWALDQVMGQEARALWHKDEDLAGVQCVVLPGGFSYGDYLRCGAIARFRSDHEKRRALRRRRRPGAGNLQRLPDSVRGASAARRADAQSLALLHLRARSTCGSKTPTRPLPAPRARARCCGCRSSTARASTSRPPKSCARWKSAARWCCATPIAAGHERDDANPNGSTRAIAGRSE